MKILRWRDIAGRDLFHAARYAKLPAQSAPHGHDFAELFWIDGGEAEHQINGARVPLRPGSVVLMRPEDKHDICVRSRTGPLGLTNIAFPREVLNSLGERYFRKRREFFWSREELPFMVQIDASRLRRLNGWADALSRAPRERLPIDLFLLNVLAELSGDGQRQLPAQAPSWLLEACDRIKQPTQLSGGVETFLRLCGRSREHVARTVRRHLRTTPTDYVNRMRMTQARRELEMGNREILDIALDCGIGNLSHFYELFRRETGTTPRAYRLAHRRPL